MNSWHQHSAVRPSAAWIAAPLGGLLSTSAVLLGASSLPWHHMPPRYRLAGSLHCEGRPAPDAVLTFHPLEKRLLVYPQAVVQPDGRFEVRTPYCGAGAPAGEYAVTVNWRPYVIEGEHFGPGPNIVADQYADPSRTPLRVTVEPRANRLAAWTIARGRGARRAVTADVSAGASPSQ